MSISPILPPPEESEDAKQAAARQRYLDRLSKLQPDTIRVAVLAETVNDIERMRISVGNRKIALDQVKAGPVMPGYAELATIFDSLVTVEKNAVRELERAVKAHRIGPHVLATKGIGLKGVGRFLAAVGEIGDRRSPAQLWAYCGLDVRAGVAPHRSAGLKSDWNNRARTRALVMVDPIVKTGGPYREVYDAARAKYADADISKGHQHNRAKRAVAKAILKDLWRYLRSLDAAKEQAS